MVNYEHNWQHIVWDVGRYWKVLPNKLAGSDKIGGTLTRDHRTLEVESG